MLNMPAPDKQFAADMQLEIEKWKKEKSSNFLFSDAINIFSGIITYHDMPEMILNTCLNPKKTYEEKIRSSYSKDKAKYIIENSNPKIIKEFNKIVKEFNDNIKQMKENKDPSLGIKLAFEANKLVE